MAILQVGRISLAGEYERFLKVRTVLILILVMIALAVLCITGFSFALMFFYCGLFFFIIFAAIRFMAKMNQYIKMTNQHVHEVKERFVKIEGRLDQIENSLDMSP